MLDFARRSSSRLASLNLLYDPAVAVGVVEREERAVVLALWIRPGQLFARLEVEDLAGIQPALDQLGMCAIMVLFDHTFVFLRSTSAKKTNEKKEVPRFLSWGALWATGYRRLKTPTA
jgi:hypothetical protein